MKKRKQKPKTKTKQKQLRPIQDVLEEHRDAFMSLRGVCGIGASVRNNKPCIKIFLGSDDPSVKARIPSMIQGYKVVVIKTGNIAASGSGSRR